jgi:hypothetical protein
VGHGMDIDVRAVIDMAASVEDTARSVSALVGVSGSFGFGRAVAGRNYADVGDRIVAGYERVASSFRVWSDALDDNAGRLRASVDGYRAVDSASAESIGAPR